MKQIDLDTKIENIIIHNDMRYKDIANVLVNLARWISNLEKRIQQLEAKLEEE